MTNVSVPSSARSAGTAAVMSSPPRHQRRTSGVERILASSGTSDAAAGRSVTCSPWSVSTLAAEGRLGVADEVADDLARGLDVVYNGAGFACPERRVFDVTVKVGWRCTDCIPRPVEIGRAHV